MQTYDPARRPPYQSAIPAMRHAPEHTSSHSATPIYDALYAEYRMAFRTLPGDRSGEEDLGFKAFAGLSGFAGFTGFVTGLHGAGPLQPVLRQAGAPGAGSGFPGLRQDPFPGPRHDLRQLPGPSHTAAHTAYGPHTPPAAQPTWTHVASTAAQQPHQADRPGGYQTGTWRPVRRPHGPEDLLPAVLPIRHPGDPTDH